MTAMINDITLHRTAKYFMDNGRAASPEDALDLLSRFGLTIQVGQEIFHSSQHQTALLTVINAARRTLLAGIEIVGLCGDAQNLTALAGAPTLKAAIEGLGGLLVEVARAEWPTAVIGSAVPREGGVGWQLTWEGWRGGVTPIRQGKRLNERTAISIAPVLAAAVAAAEIFAYHAGDHAMAGRRAAGLSLWRPDVDWLVADISEVALTYLPSRLWLLGLGNLGQAYSWILATLPYRDRREVHLFLQDFDRIAASNDSTSLLSTLRDVDKRKARVVAGWLDRVGFETFTEERRFGPWTKRQAFEPGVILCGVDNAEARSALEQAGFDLIVEAGLGTGPEAFRSFALHTFPSSRKAADLWRADGKGGVSKVEAMPAYDALRKRGLDRCGLTQLASRSVGAPFVGLIAACFAIAELLRRLNGGAAIEFLSGSALSLGNLEWGALNAPVYSHGHVAATMEPSETSAL